MPSTTPSNTTPQQPTTAQQATEATVIQKSLEFLTVFGRALLWHQQQQLHLTQQHLSNWQLLNQKMMRRSSAVAQLAVVVEVLQMASSEAETGEHVRK